MYINSVASSTDSLFNVTFIWNNKTWHIMALLLQLFLSKSKWRPHALLLLFITPKQQKNTQNKHIQIKLSNI